MTTRSSGEQAKAHSDDASPPGAMTIPETVVKMTCLLDPSMTDERGYLSPGQLLKSMDSCACMSAERFAGRSCVTAAMDDVVLHNTLHNGDVVIVQSQVNRAFGTSMEVGCRVTVENLETSETTHVCSAYFTFVALAPDGSKVKLPTLAIYKPAMKLDALAPTGLLSPNQMRGRVTADATSPQATFVSALDLASPVPASSTSPAASSASPSLTAPSSASTSSPLRLLDPLADIDFPKPLLEEGAVPLPVKSEEELQAIDNVRRWEEAQERRNLRLQRRAIIAQTESDLRRGHLQVLQDLQSKMVLSPPQKPAFPMVGDRLLEEQKLAASATSTSTGLGVPAGESNQGSVRTSVLIAGAVTSSNSNSVQGTSAPESGAPSSSASSTVSVPAPSSAQQSDRRTSAFASPHHSVTRLASESVCEDTQLVLPIHANHMHTCFGGQLMTWIGAACTIAGIRFAREPMIMEGIDDIHFFCPIRLGDRVVVKAQVNRSFSHSIEVGCRLERLSLSGELVHGLSAYMTFKTRSDRELRYELVPVTANEQRRWAQALGRKRLRLQRKSIHSLGGEIPLWAEHSRLELIYSNIRSLLLVNNTSTFGANAWELVGPPPSPTDESRLRMYVQRGQASTASSPTHTCIRVVAKLPLPPEQVYSFMLDLSLRRAWDLTSMGAEVVRRIDQDNDICWFKLRSRPPGRPQDYILLRSWRVMTNPASNALQYVISNRSIAHPEFPPFKDFERADVLSSGFIIRPVRAGPSKQTSLLAGTSTAAPSPMELGSSSLSRSVSGAGESSTEYHSELSYCVQLGSKALRIGIGDIVGDSQVIRKSFERLYQLVLKGGAVAAREALAAMLAASESTPSAEVVAHTLSPTKPNAPES